MARFGNVAGDQLLSIINRIEKLEEERSNIGADITEVYAEAHSNGYDKKTLRQVIKLRKLEGSEREEQDHLMDTYLRALGMLPQMDDEEEAS